eukprot:6153255-Prymnesium_polylepis.1
MSRTKLLHRDSECTRNRVRVRRSITLWFLAPEPSADGVKLDGVKLDGVKLDGWQKLSKSAT